MVLLASSVFAIRRRMSPLNPSNQGWCTNPHKVDMQTLCNQPLLINNSTTPVSLSPTLSFCSTLLTYTPWAQFYSLTLFNTHTHSLHLFFICLMLSPAHQFSRDHSVKIHLYINLCERVTFSIKPETINTWAFILRQTKLNFHLVSNQMYGKTEVREVKSLHLMVPSHFILFLFYAL